MWALWLVLSYNPLAAGDVRDNLCRYVAANKCSYGNAWNGHYGRQCQRILNDDDAECQPEDMNQIHSKAEFRQLGNDARSCGCINAGKE